MHQFVPMMEGLQKNKKIKKKSVQYKITQITSKKYIQRNQFLQAKGKL